MDAAVENVNFWRVWRRTLNRLDNAVWWVRYRVQPGLSRHKIKLGLPPGWYEPDTQMIESMMACLRDYVEARDGIDALERFAAELRSGYAGDPDQQISCNRQADMEAEAAAIWRWWTETRPAQREAHTKELMRLYSGENNGLTKSESTTLGAERDQHHRDEMALDAAEDAMLERLLKIRRCLWT